MKKCKICQEIKELELFPKYYKKSGGYKTYCKDCDKEIYKNRSENNKAKYLSGELKHPKNKKCSKCKIIKTSSSFDKNYNSSTGLSSYCRDCKNKRSRDLYKSNIEYYRAKDREYYRKNRDSIRLVKDSRRSKRVKEDPVFRLKRNISSNIAESIKKKGYSKRTRTHKILGCSYEDMHEWLVKNSKTDYKQNYHLDHVIPISFAQTEEEVILLSHYTNFQWLDEKENIHKGNLKIKCSNLARVLSNHPSPDKVRAILNNSDFLIHY